MTYPTDPDETQRLTVNPPIEDTGSVNGQVKVPAGGQLKVPTPCG
jgi:hypothetical protein